MLYLFSNLTQRKHQAHGDKKRLASLFVAGGILLFLTAMQGAVQIGSPAWGYPAATVLTILYFWYLRRRIFIFSLKCAECSRRFTWKEIFYFDSPDCTCTEATPRNVDDVDWENWKAKEEAVLCFIVKDGSVLLIHKKNRSGSRQNQCPRRPVEPGETPEEAAVRETIEETGLTPFNLEERTELCFVFADGYSLHGRAFFANDCSGEMTETDEADPFWCRLEEIPYEKHVGGRSPLDSESTERRTSEGCFYL